MFFQKRSKFLGRDGFLIDGFRIDMLIGIGGDVILFLALLADEQERPLAGIEALVAERLLNELRLAGIQKTGKA